MRKWSVAAIVAATVLVLGCTVGPRDPDGNPIPTGPNKTIEPDHPPKPRQEDVPNIVNLIVTTNIGPVDITGTIVGERHNGPPSQPIAGRIGSGGGTWKGYAPYFDTNIGIYIRADYKGSQEYLESLHLQCEINEPGRRPVIRNNLVGSPLVECAYNTAG